MLGFVKEFKLKKQVKKLTEENVKLNETISSLKASGSTKTSLDENGQTD